MKFINHKTHNSEIEIIEVHGELIGQGGIVFHDYLCTCLDKGKRCWLINLEFSKKIDGLGIAVLEQFTQKDMRIGLFNVSYDIRTMFEMSRKELSFKVYNETESGRAVSLFEEEIQEEGIAKDGANNRHYTRINTHIPAEFKYHPGHNGVISARASIINLSEGGAFADRITAVNTTNGEILHDPDMSGHELYDMKFRLNGSTELIETKGECVREFKKEGNLSVGMKFNDMKEEQKEKIKDYVSTSFKDNANKV